MSFEERFKSKKDAYNKGWNLGRLQYREDVKTIIDKVSEKTDNVIADKSFRVKKNDSLIELHDYIFVKLRRELGLEK